MTLSIPLFRTLLFLSATFFFMPSCVPRWVQEKRAKFIYEEGQVLLSNGDIDKAMGKFTESRRLAESAGFKAGVAHNLNEMAVVYTLKGQHMASREALSEALEIYRGLNMAPEISKVIDNIAKSYISVQDFGGAIKQYEILLEWDRQTQNRLGEAITLRNMGHIYRHYLSGHEKAYGLYSESLRVFKELGQEGRARSVEKDMEGVLKHLKDGKTASESE